MNPATIGEKGEPTIGELCALGAMGLDSAWLHMLRTNPLSRPSRENAARIDALVAEHVAKKDAEIERLMRELAELRAKVEAGRPLTGKTEEIKLPSGVTLFVSPDLAGGRHYASDEVGGGVTVWVTSLVDERTLLFAMAHEREFVIQEQRRAANETVEREG